MTAHEELIQRVDKILTQSQGSIQQLQDKLNGLLEQCNDPAVLATVLARQASAVKTLAEATLLLSKIRKDGERTSDTDWLSSK